MKQALANFVPLVPLVTLGVLAGSFWYVGARLHALFGAATRRLLASAVAGGVVASGVAMLGAATSIFVSQGAGTFVTRVRLGTSNELNFIRLQPGGRA